MPRVVIMAGGKGTRLAPYTTVFPKPLMPLGEMPILELLLRQLVRVNVPRATVAVGHLASLIMAYFGSGERLGIELDYSLEEIPLGTAGPLLLVPGLAESFLVLNGDLLTDLDFQSLLNEHRRRQAVATIGVFERQVQIDLGVVQADASQRIIDYVEKPSYTHLVSMGAYVFEPSVLRYIPPGGRFDLPDLVRTLIAANEPVVGFRHVGYWLDIGRADDYLRAQQDFPSLRERIL